jgi:hypothetical protein
MRNRQLIASGLVLLTACVSTRHLDKQILIVSEKTGVKIKFSLPEGFIGGDRITWPSYEVWSFSNGEEPNITRLSIRVDRIAPEKSDGMRAKWLTTTDAETEVEISEDRVEPKVKTLTYSAIDGQAIRIRRVDIPMGDHQCSGNIISGNSEIGLELFSESEDALSKNIPAFIKFLSSLHIVANSH